MKSKFLLFFALLAMTVTGCQGNKKTSSSSAPDVPHSVTSEEESTEPLTEPIDTDPISMLAINGVQVPTTGVAVGDLDAVEIDHDGVGIDLENSFWEDEDGFFSDFGDSSNVFEGGRIYKARLCLTYPYEFVEHASIFINTKPADLLSLSDDKTKYVVRLTFPSTELVEHHEIYVTGVTDPVAGETPTFAGISVTNTGCVIAQHTWVVNYDNENHNFFYSASEDTIKFHEGDTYGIKIMVQSTDLDFATDVKAYINGEEAEIISKEDKLLTFVYLFSRLEGKYQIHSLSLSNVPTPAVGQIPSALNVIELSSDLVTLSIGSNLYWIVYNSDGVSHKFFARGGEGSSPFEAGNKYGISIIVNCKNNEEAEFVDEGFEVSASAGISVLVEKCGTGDLNRRIVIGFLPL